MRVSIIGQAAFGEAVFRRLLADGIELAGVSAPPPAEGGRADPLWAAAAEAAVPLVPTPALKEAASLQRWRELAADLCLMAFVTDILPAGVFSAARLGTIQYHPSLLPLHRGSSAINWAIIHGREETGVTIFWPDEGIDTGPILLQERVPIGPEDTVGSLYFDQLFPLGVEAMAEAVARVAGGDPPRVDQQHEFATYEPPCRDEHAQVHWYEPAQRVHALIRGCNPQPGAWTLYEGEKLRLFDVRLLARHEPGMPGRILAIDDEAFEVRLNGGPVLRVLRVQPPGGKKMPAGAWAASAGISPGYRFRQ